MKIERIDGVPVRIPLKPKRVMISALGQQVTSENLLVRVSTGAGVDGVGEATVAACWSGETVRGAQALIEEVLTPRLIGMDPFDIASIDAVMDRSAHGNWFAKSAIEMACWDIQGREQGRPVYELLGGPVRSRVIRCRFSMGAYDPPRARQTAAELVASGFDTIKVKVGTDFEQDVERVRIVRETIGPDRDLVIDANCGFDADTAIRFAGTVADCRVGLFEQPTPRGDFAALAQVRRRVDMPVMADDICFDLADARECIRNDAVDVISVYPGKNGGIRKSRQIAEFAAAHQVPCSIGSNLEFDVASAAMCHLVVGCPNMDVERFPGDILGPEYHEFSIVREPLVINGPQITVPDRPGLGVDVDWAKLK